MSTAPDLFERSIAATTGWPLGTSSRLNLAILASIILHAVVLFGITFKFPLPENSKAFTSLEVVLVNSRSASRPNKPDALAQATLDGGGNTDSNRRAKTPFPVIPKHSNTADTVADTAVATQKMEQLEQEEQRLMAAVNSDDDHSVYQADLPFAQSEQSQAFDASDLLQRSFEIARLEAQTAQNHEVYQKRPKRKFVGARTQEYRFARYVEDWRLKVERVGNLNYPEAARREQLYGNLQLTVGIKSDGSLESIAINRPSGKKVLDEAAVRIVNLAGQNGFAPFPPEISRDTDVLHITRTWVFTRSDQLASE
ncbi:protein TonB [Nitrosospira briensis]|uniref:Protein TonB n=1 Tax=Nitrosospira briensis TaxID=35799 RepID=A0A1I5AED7_9PROT|nr:TonB family protein [Nitrosospira briensis]SFN60793.1 protein TonB [Nitrosospira briensis]